MLTMPHDSPGNLLSGYQRFWRILNGVTATAVPNADG